MGIKRYFKRALEKRRVAEEIRTEQAIEKKKKIEQDKKMPYREDMTDAEVLSQLVIRNHEVAALYKKIFYDLGELKAEHRKFYEEQNSPLFKYCARTNEAAKDFNTTRRNRELLKSLIEECDNNHIKFDLRNTVIIELVALREKEYKYLKDFGYDKYSDFSQVESPSIRKAVSNFNQLNAQINKLYESVEEKKAYDPTMAKTIQDDLKTLRSSIYPSSSGLVRKSTPLDRLITRVGKNKPHEKGFVDKLRERVGRSHK